MDGNVDALSSNEVQAKNEPRQLTQNEKTDNKKKAKSRMI